MVVSSIRTLTTRASPKGIRSIDVLRDGCPTEVVFEPCGGLNPSLTDLPRPTDRIIVAPSAEPREIENRPKGALEDIDQVRSFSDQPECGGLEGMY